jgi:excisionase family DNA binding protein
VRKSAAVIESVPITTSQRQFDCVSPGHSAGQNVPVKAIEFVLNAFADMMADRLEHRQEARRRLLDMEGVCEYLGCSEDTIYRLVSDKKLTPVQVDRRKRFDIREVDGLIDEAKRTNSTCNK